MLRAKSGKQIMKKGVKVSLFLLFLVIPVNTYAQGEKLDRATIDSINKQGEELYLKARELSEKDEIRASIPYYEQALKIFKNVDNKHNIAAASSCLGEVYYYMDQYKNAIENYKISVQLFLETADTIYALRDLLDLKNCYVKNAQRKDVLIVDSAFYAILSSITNDSLRLTTYYYLAENMYHDSKYRESCSFYKKFLDMCPQLETKENYNKISWACLRMVQSYKNLDEWDHVVYWSKKFLSLQSSPYFTSSDKIAAYTNLINGYSMMLDTIHTEQMVDSMFAMSQDESFISKRKCDMHLLCAIAFSNLKMFDKSLEHYDKAAMYATELKDTTGLIKICGNRAVLYFSMKKYAQSADELQKYVDLLAEIYPGTYRYHKCMYNLATARGFAGQIEEGRRVIVKMLHEVSNMIDTQFKYISSNARDAFWSKYAEFLNYVLTYNIGSGNPQDSFTEELYNTLLYCKGMLLSSDKQTSDIIKSKGSEEDIQCYEQLNKYRSDYESLSQHPKGHEEELATLFASIQSMDKQLTDHISSYGNVAAFTKVKYQNVKNALQDGETIIDIAVVEGQYLAFIVRKQDEHPIRLKLFTQDQQDSLKSAKGTSLDALYEYDENLSTIKLCWKPFEKYLKDCKRVYYIPAGDMHSVAFESLPISQDSLLSDKYQIIRLSSAREICKKKVKNSYKNAVLYGGLNYTIDADLMAKNSRKTPVDELLAMRGGPAFGDSIFSDLKSTQKEVESIQKILKKQHVKTQILSEDKGTSESFFSLSGNAPNLIHLATHGFYYTPEDGHSVAGLKNVKSAMQLSGVILSGGNAGWLGKKLPEGTLGGVLTASDISRMDLENVDLVCLSACETAKGKVTSDGVYGLQRALKMAGVKSIVMSLWNVSDWATKELMIYFYQALADNSWNSHEAMEIAKLKMRQKYSEPFYWAGFIVMD